MRICRCDGASRMASVRAAVCVVGTDAYGSRWAPGVRPRELTFAARRARRPPCALQAGTTRGPEPCPAHCATPTPRTLLRMDGRMDVCWLRRSDRHARAGCRSKDVRRAAEAIIEASQEAPSCPRRIRSARVGAGHACPFPIEKMKMGGGGETRELNVRWLVLIPGRGDWDGKDRPKPHCQCRC